MRYLGWLFPAFLILEVVSIVMVSQWLGIWTLVLMALQFFTGIFLMRNLGFSSVLMAGETLRKNPQGLSVYQLMWPIRFIISAILLISPGFVSTAIAAGLMLPLKGGPKTNIGSEQAQQAYQQYRQRQNNHADGDIIDGDYSEVKPSPSRPSNDVPRIEP
ncbi:MULTISPECIES: FxsA family protein [Vitreoscilla]|uniref:FxsA family protein n=1 Tax=Vitreoscilla stercoraria TaxID=61 RepID=A0ABY4EB68_VITST|nr:MULTISPECIES: FxsA family protein [Vitreoscilla]AUZ05585.1 hypothetical protein ADP71_21750 [Vitreoscilla sp. C1]UOO92996.1 FxsA family protein [Vitreoscilla stercoraria]